MIALVLKGIAIIICMVIVIDSIIKINKLKV
jgi:hypothetical protein